MSPNRIFVCLIVASVTPGICETARAQCDFDWDARFGPPGTNAQVSAAIVWDDGTGPALYVAGDFTTAGGVAANRVAKWNGTSFAALGTGVNNSVYALTVWNGALYVGGMFTTAGGATANRIASWNGTSWSPLMAGVTNGLNNFVYALGTYAGSLCAGGAFTDAGGVTTADRLAKWNGSAWSAAGTGNGPDYQVYAIQEWNGSLYIAGEFLNVGGIAANRIARWSGTAWSVVGTATGTDSAVRTLVLYDNGSGTALYAGGDFTKAGGVNASRVARWSGTAWSALGTGMSGGSFTSVRALAVHNDGSGSTLYAGGDFSSAGGVTAYCAAKWNGTAWSALGSGMSIAGGGQTIYALSSFNDGRGPGLFAGGYFTYAGSGWANYVARWAGASWSGLGYGVNSDVYALTTFNDGSGPALYAGGGFEHAGGVYAPRVARLNSTGWSRVGTIVPSDVRTLKVLNFGGGPALFAGGYIIIGGQNCIGRWDGTAWTSSGCGMDTTVYTVEVFNHGTGPALYIGGVFTMIGAGSYRYIARWNGSAWSAVGGGMNSYVNALAVADSLGSSVLYTGGLFSLAGGVSAIGAAIWNGATWSELDNTGGLTVSAWLIFDNDGAGPNAPALYAARGSTVSRWNPGSPGSWTVIGGGMNSTVSALTVYDDGTGPALYAGGSFTIAGGYAANRIAKWDGTRWWPLGSGIGSTLETVYALAVLDDGSGAALYAGGNFTTAGGRPSARVARWASRQVRADVEQSPASQTKNVGEMATFSVTAEGTPPLSYHWRKGGSPLSDGGSISGSTLATLTINPVGLTDAGSYDVVVTNACGATDTSDAAILTVTCVAHAPADLDGDCDVDTDDSSAFKSCVSGPAIPSAAGCGSRDLDGDEDVDLDDFAILQRCYGGANNLADPNCGI